jgi:hypothetical protein
MLASLHHHAGDPATSPSVSSIISITCTEQFIKRGAPSIQPKLFIQLLFTRDDHFAARQDCDHCAAVNLSTTSVGDPVQFAVLDQTFCGWTARAGSSVSGEKNV